MDNKNDLLNSLSDLVQTDSDLERFLLCTPHSSSGSYSYDAALSEAFFYKHLYVYSDTGASIVDEISDILMTNRRKSIFILGNKGCGKTTFLYSLRKSLLKKPGFRCLPIDFAELAPSVTIDRAKAKIGQFIYAMLREAVQNNRIDMLNSFISRYFRYEDSFDIAWDQNNLLDEFYTAFRSSLNNNVEDLSYQIKHKIRPIINKLEIFQQFLLLVLLDMENQSFCSTLHTAIALDNLDGMVDIADIASLIDNFFKFDTNIGSLLKAITGSSRYTYNYTFIFVMRETTKSNISSHSLDAMRVTSREYDLTSIYSKKEIITKRLQVYCKAAVSPANTSLADSMLAVVSDSYIHQTIFPFYNNDYRVSTMKLIDICKMYPQMIDQYKALIAGDEDSKFGGRGIIYRLILSDLQKKGYFSRLMIVDFAARENATSLPRLLLTYLSNTTSVSCLGDDDYVPLSRLFDAFNMLNQDDIVECLWAMFDLIKTNDWNHLVTFARSKRATKERLYDEIKIYKASRFRRASDEYSCFRITCAGEIYLSNICTHYEFFSCRALGENYLPLFCKENLQKANGKYTFEDIIDAVYQQAFECCKALNESFESPNGLCCEARTPFNYRSDRIVQFHSERIVFSHIGYLDAYRCYVLKQFGDVSGEGIDIEVISKRILHTIKQYCNLISGSVAKCAATRAFNDILVNLDQAEKAPRDATRTINRRK